MLINFLILIAGFVLLIKSATFLVDGASSMAKKLGVSTLVIGLTVVAFGTSAPELIVNLIASLQGSSEIAIGNILGSNIANTLLILGLAATITTIRVQRNTTFKEIPFSLLAIVMLALLVNDQIIDNATTSILSRIDGFVLLGFFIIFLYYTFGIAKVQGGEEDVQIKRLKTWQSVAMVIGGLIGLTIGGKLVVDNAVAIATLFGVSEALIGLTIVAVGTSLPELVTSVVAAYKKQPEIVIGNIIGSNIFNVLWILGLSAIIKPLPFSSALNVDVIIAVSITIIFFAFMLLGERHSFKRIHGVSFLLMYLAYILFLIFRG